MRFMSGLYRYIPKRSLCLGYLKQPRVFNSFPLNSYFVRNITTETTIKPLETIKIDESKKEQKTNPKIKFGWNFETFIIGGSLLVGGKLISDLTYDNWYSNVDFFNSLDSKDKILLRKQLRSLIFFCRGELYKTILIYVANFSTPNMIEIFFEPEFITHTMKYLDFFLLAFKSGPNNEFDISKLIMSSGCPNISLDKAHYEISLRSYNAMLQCDYADLFFYFWNRNSNTDKKEFLKISQFTDKEILTSAVLSGNVKTFEKIVDELKLLHNVLQIHQVILTDYNKELFDTGLKTLDHELISHLATIFNIPIHNNISHVCTQIQKHLEASINLNDTLKISKGINLLQQLVKISLSYEQVYVFVNTLININIYSLQNNDEYKTTLESMLTFMSYGKNPLFYLSSWLETCIIHDNLFATDLILNHIYKSLDLEPTNETKQPDIYLSQLLKEKSVVSLLLHLYKLKDSPKYKSLCLILEPAITELIFREKNNTINQSLSYLIVNIPLNILYDIKNNTISHSVLPSWLIDSIIGVKNGKPNISLENHVDIPLYPEALRKKYFHWSDKHVYLDEDKCRVEKTYMYRAYTSKQKPVFKHMILIAKHIDQETFDEIIKLRDFETLKFVLQYVKNTPSINFDKLFTKQFRSIDSYDAYKPLEIARYFKMLEVVYLQSGKYKMNKNVVLDALTRLRFTLPKSDNGLLVGSAINFVNNKIKF